MYKYLSIYLSYPSIDLSPPLPPSLSLSLSLSLYLSIYLSFYPSTSLSLPLSLSEDPSTLLLAAPGWGRTVTPRTLVTIVKVLSNHCNKVSSLVRTPKMTNNVKVAVVNWTKIVSLAARGSAGTASRRKKTKNVNNAAKPVSTVVILPKMGRHRRILMPLLSQPPRRNINSRSRSHKPK